MIKKSIISSLAYVSTSVNSTSVFLLVVYKTDRNIKMEYSQERGVID